MAIGRIGAAMRLDQFLKWMGWVATGGEAIRSGIPQVDSTAAPSQAAPDDWHSLHAGFCQQPVGVDATDGQAVARCGIRRSATHPPGHRTGSVGVRDPKTCSIWSRFPPCRPCFTSQPIAEKGPFSKASKGAAWCLGKNVVR